MCISPKVAIKLNSPAQLKVRGASDHEFQSILRNSNNKVEQLQMQRLQAFLDEEPAYHAEMEINQLGFSEHLFEFKAGLEHLAENETLKVCTKSQLVIKELVVACRIMKLPIETSRLRKRCFLYATRPTRASVHPIKPEKAETTNPQFKLAAP